MAIEVRNTARTSGRKGWYQWRVFLDGPDPELDEVQEVTYVLHPTFPERVKVVRERSSGFALATVGWGEFEIGVTILKKNGEVEKKAHWLDFSGAAQIPEGGAD